MTDGDIDDLDRRLREWAEHHRLSAPPVGLDQTRLDNPSRPRWTALGLVAAVIAAIAVLAVAIRSGGSVHHRAAVTPGPTASVSTPTPVSVPSGERQATFHGLSIFVPTSWTSNQTECGTPQGNTVIVPPGEVPLCLMMRPAGITSVEWTRWVSSTRHGYEQPLSAPSVTALDIDGHPGTRTDGLLHGLHVTRLVVPDLRAGLQITTPAQAIADRIVASLQVVDRSPEGCASHTTRTTINRLARPIREHAQDDLVPGTPTSTLVCRYVDGYFEQAFVPTDHGRQLITTINALPGGLSIARPGTYIPSLCDPHNTAPIADIYRLDESYLLHVGYASGPPLDLVARLGFCGDLGASNGARTGQRTNTLIETLTRAAGSSGMIPSAIPKP